jgi:serine phosphatase RsbU (regulator of sigma subunit)
LIHALDTAEHRRGGNVDPIEVMRELNARICAHARGMGWFATAVYGVLDLHSGALSVAGAGHPPPVVIGGGASFDEADLSLRSGGFAATPVGGRSALARQTRQFRELSTMGPVLGLDDQAEFTLTTTHLALDEALLIYSDGLESVFPSAHPDEAELVLRERPHLKQLRSLSERIAGVHRFATSEEDLLDLAPTSTQIAAMLTEEIDAQEGSLHQADDITAIVIRRCAMGVDQRIAA